MYETELTAIGAAIGVHSAELALEKWYERQQKQLKAKQSFEKSRLHAQYLSDLHRIKKEAKSYGSKKRLD